MFPFQVSLTLFDRDSTQVPTPRIIMNASRPGTFYCDPMLCSCNEANTRIGRYCALTQTPLDTKVVSYHAESFANCFRELGAPEGQQGENARSLHEQEKLLHVLRKHCDHNRPDAQGVLGPVTMPPKTLSCIFGGKEQQKKAHADNIFSNTAFTGFSSGPLHQAYRKSPLALHLNAHYKIPGARCRAANKSILEFMKAETKGLKGGRLYIMQNPTNSQYLKVGCTTSDLASKRHNELKSCHTGLRLLKETTDVQWPQRVEQLVFKELSL